MNFEWDRRFTLLQIVSIFPRFTLFAFTRCSGSQGLCHAYSSICFYSSGDTTLGCCASRDPQCNRIEVARVHACTSTHAICTHGFTCTHTIAHKDQGVADELRVPGFWRYKPFLFFSLPFFFYVHPLISFVHAPQRIVRFTVPIRSYTARGFLYGGGGWFYPS